MQLFTTTHQTGAVPFSEKVLREGAGPLRATGLSTLQVNVGLRCNQTCGHCHLEAGPARNEMMSRETAAQVLQALAASGIGTLDITGGAPELNPVSRMLATGARELGRRVIVRTNLSVLAEPGMEGLPEFYRRNNVELTASLPCYLEENVDRMRGSGAFEKSIAALRTLNDLGYGHEEKRSLRLVYNPAGPFLPPSQEALEQDYKRELSARYGITFTSLYAFANMPIGRFRDVLDRENRLKTYQDMLAASFNPRTLDRLMCRTLISVAWNGALFDCDFNQALGIPLRDQEHAHISRFDRAALAAREIAVSDHCYACTAGQGSS